MVRYDCCLYNSETSFKCVDTCIHLVLNLDSGRVPPLEEHWCEEATSLTYPFCLHEMPLLIRARRNSISTCSGLLLEVVETLLRSWNQKKKCKRSHSKIITTHKPQVARGLILRTEPQTRSILLPWPPPTWYSAMLRFSINAETKKTSSTLKIDSSHEMYLTWCDSSVDSSEILQLQQVLPHWNVILPQSQ